MKYIKLFESHEDYGDFVSGGTMLKPNVSHCVNENEVHYNGLHDYSKDYLTIESLVDNNRISWFTVGDETHYYRGNPISYSVDNGETWNTISSGNVTTLNKGEKVLFKGNNNDYTYGGRQSEVLHCRFGATGPHNVCGNIMSMVYEDEFENTDTLSGTMPSFGDAYGIEWNLISAENLILPATTLADYCYGYMFAGCVNLETAPSILPATTLAESCYYGMFAGCASLTTAPELPATTLADRCYSYMFRECESLTTVPELPATTMEEYCYSSMFYGCTGLTVGPELPAITMAPSCYNSMFNSCTSLVNAPALPATTLAVYCYGSMFKNCTSLTTEAVVPNSVTPVASSYCGAMYCGCPITTQNGKYDSQAYGCDEGPIK